jgi:hypothetical protein
MTLEVIKFFAGDNYVNKENGICYFYPSIFTDIGFYTSILSTERCGWGEPCCGWGQPCSPDEGISVKIKIGQNSEPAITEPEIVITEFDYDEFNTPDGFSFNNTTITINES